MRAAAPMGSMGSVLPEPCGAQLYLGKQRGGWQLDGTVTTRLLQLTAHRLPTLSIALTCATQELPIAKANGREL